MTTRSLPAPTASLALLALSYVGFISLGLPDSILGAAWPVIRSDLALPLDAAGPLVLLSTAGTVLSSALSGRLLSRLPTGAVLVGSTLLAATALGAFALARSWYAMMAAAVIAGLGGGAIDSALNGFVARHYDVRHMNWLHGCWGVGATLGPVTLSLMLAAGRSWRNTYALLAAVEVTLALAFVATLGRWQRAAGAASRREGAARLTAAMRGSVAFFFVYGGLEAAAGLWGASFLIAVKGATPALASAVVAVYWGGLTVGRFALGAVSLAIGQRALVRASVWGALAAAVVLAVPGAPLAMCMVALAALGLALAAIYPTVMHDTPHRFGEAAAAHLVGYQIAAGAAGIATFPWLLGIAARRLSPGIIPAGLVALAVVMVLLEALRGRTSRS